MLDYRVRIGLRDPDSSKYVGDAAQWDKAEAALRAEAQRLGADYIEEPGEAAFYGPKIDFVVKDVIGREWQLGTVQVDYNLPERFDLSYIGSDNEKHRPVMIHRAPFGSMERFVGLLIEHFGGNFPTWLAPEQVRVIPMNDALVPLAKEITQQIRQAKIRVQMDPIADKVGAKIRRAELDKVPYMLILGKREAEEGKISVRARANKTLEALTDVSSFIAALSSEIDQRALPPTKTPEDA
jgi:threonyl-tRNA synthetase